MKNIHIYLAAALLTFAFLFNSCATTDLTSWKSPDYKGGVFKNIFVIAFMNDLGDRQAVENTITERFKDYGLTAMPSLSVLSPGDSITFDKMEELLDKYKIDGIVTLKVTSKKNIETYIPPVTTYYSYYSYYWGWWGNSAFYTRPGYYVNSGEDVKIETKLFENAKNTLVWQGQSESIDYESSKALAYDLGVKIIKDWKLNGLIK